MAEVTVKKSAFAGICRLKSKKLCSKIARAPVRPPKTIPFAKGLCLEIQAKYTSLKKVIKNQAASPSPMKPTSEINCRKSLWA